MDHQLTLNGNNCCLSSGLLTCAAAAETVHDTTVTIDYVLDGIIASKTAITDGATPTTDYVTGAAFSPIVGGGSVAGAYGNGCIVLWGLIAGGTVKCIQGAQQALDVSGNFIVAPAMPNYPSTFVPFAYQVLKAKATASATAIVFGTANWNATGFTNVIKNVMVLPVRPVVA